MIQPLDRLTEAFYFQGCLLQGVALALQAALGGTDSGGWEVSHGSNNDLGDTAPHPTLGWTPGLRFLTEGVPRWLL